MGHKEPVNNHLKYIEHTITYLLIDMIYFSHKVQAVNINEIAQTRSQTKAPNILYIMPSEPGGFSLQCNKYLHGFGAMTSTYIQNVWRFMTTPYHEPGKYKLLLMDERIVLAAISIAKEWGIRIRPN